MTNVATVLLYLLYLLGESRGVPRTEITAEGESLRSVAVGAG
jgi:hypothetical protein